MTDTLERIALALERLADSAEAELRREYETDAAHEARAREQHDAYMANAALIKRDGEMREEQRVEWMLQARHLAESEGRVDSAPVLTLARPEEPESA